jgi:hypothetical protein
MVVGLGSRFEGLQSSLTVLNIGQSISLSDFYNMLLLCESITVKNAQACDFVSSANAAARRDQGRGDGARPFDGVPDSGRYGGLSGGGQQQQPSGGNNHYGGYGNGGGNTNNYGGGGQK